MSEPVWIVYDGRAISGFTDDATVLESFGVDVAKDDLDAVGYARSHWNGHEYALYRYDINKKRQAENGRLIDVGIFNLT